MEKLKNSGRSRMPWPVSINGEAEIRTQGGPKPTTVFKTAAFNRSATSPTKKIFKTLQSPIQTFAIKKMSQP